MVGSPVDLWAPLDTGGRAIVRVQVHHTAGSELDTPEQVERYAMGRGIGFVCDPYHVHIWRGPDVGELGVSPWRVSWGRDPALDPAGSEGENTGAIAVVVHGDYSRGPLPVWAEDRLVDVLAWVCRSADLDERAIWGHRELPGEATACPGVDMGPIRSAVRAALS